jgi:glycosyltransferase involved in cell wall biosynthesis
MSQPLFTVATITYNSSKWVRQAIESVLASSYTHFEYIISDDCSTDDTWEIIKEYIDPRIRSWRNDSNIGEYPNRNKALKEARGQYILYIDGDDILYKSTLRNLSEYISEFPTAGMIWGVSTSANLYVVLPYIFEPDMTLKLLYSHLSHLSVIGFGETVFKTESIRNLSRGFPNNYIAGDYYIRKKIALTEKVLFIPLGLSFWRTSKNQSSKKLGINYSGMIEAYEIDLKILSDEMNPLNILDRDEILKNIKISLIKRIVSQTIFKLRIISFIRLFIRMNLSVSDLFLVFKNINNTFLPIEDLSTPLFNNYNFTKTNGV